MIEAREMLLAVPGDTDDIYRRHQQVWAGMAAHVRAGTEFLYRQQSPRLMRVRSAALPGGRVVVFRAGPMAVDLVVSDRYDRNKERDVPQDRALEWAAALLHGNGFEVRAIELLQYRIVMGTKPPRDGAPGHRIRYATARFKMDLSIQDQLAAQHAWQRGIGRGRRFGFGMLVGEQ